MDSICNIGITPTRGVQSGNSIRQQTVQLRRTQTYKRAGVIRDGARVAATA